MKSRRQPLLQGTVYQKPRQCHLSGRRHRIALTGHRSRQSSLSSEPAICRQHWNKPWPDKCLPCIHSSDFKLSGVMIHFSLLRRSPESKGIALNMRFKRQKTSRIEYASADWRSLKTLSVKTFHPQNQRSQAMQYS